MKLRPNYGIYRKSTPGIEPVPVQWKPVQNFRYPVDNSHAFERWYLDTYLSSEAQERIYLPVQWTAIYCNNKFGHDKQVIKRLQMYLDKLDTSKSYYTIVQFDDGILNDVDHLDFKIFSMGGGRVDYPIPLLCMPHPSVKVAKQDLLASFIGRETHPCRKEIFALAGTDGYYISHQPHKMSDYTAYMGRSKFSLCPRGYGSSSFRICEAVMAGSIPVYISDQHCIPYNMPFDYGLLLYPGDDIDAALRGSDVSALQRRLQEVRDLFTYGGCKKMILKELMNEKEAKGKGE